MRRSFALLTLALAASLAGAPPAGSGGVEPPPPDGLLVLGVAFQDPDVRAYTREWVVVADPRTGSVRRRRLPGGTLCHGPLLVADGSVVYTGYRGRRPVTLALPMTLNGPARTLKRRIARVPGAFSPDGLRKATAVTVRGRRRVTIVDRDTGRRQLIPGGTLGGGHSIAWSPSSSWLYFTGGERRLLGYRYGAERAVPLPVDPGGEILSIATAPAPG